MALVKLPIAGDGVDPKNPETWPEVHVCDSKGPYADGSTPPQYATHRLHLQTGPIEYCWPCHELALAIYRDTLGAHVYVEELPMAATVKQILATVRRLTANAEK